MKRLCVFVCSLILLTLAQAPVQAQSGAVSQKPESPFAYDVVKEVTLSGTVSEVLSKPAPGMIMGSHLLVNTSSGVVDASLGHFAFSGKDALSIGPNDKVELTGVMKTLQGKPLFLVRSINVGGRILVLRNEHGFLLSPQAREREAQKNSATKETL